MMYLNFIKLKNKHPMNYINTKTRLTLDMNKQVHLKLTDLSTKNIAISPVFIVLTQSSHTSILNFLPRSSSTGCFQSLLSSSCAPSYSGLRSASLEAGNAGRASLLRVSLLTWNTTCNKHINSLHN